MNDPIYWTSASFFWLLNGLNTPNIMVLTIQVCIWRFPKMGVPDGPMGFLGWWLGYPYDLGNHHISHQNSTTIIMFPCIDGPSKPTTRNHQRLRGTMLPNWARNEGRRLWGLLKRAALGQEPQDRKPGRDGSAKHLQQTPAKPAIHFGGG